MRGANDFGDIFCCQTRCPRSHHVRTIVKQGTGPAHPAASCQNHPRPQYTYVVRPLIQCIPRLPHQLRRRHVPRLLATESPIRRECHSDPALTTKSGYPDHRVGMKEALCVDVLCSELGFVRAFTTIEVHRGLKGVLRPGMKVCDFRQI